MAGTSQTDGDAQTSAGLRFSDIDGFLKWIEETKPRAELLQALTARIALRVLPLLAAQNTKTKKSTDILVDLTLASFRATSISRAACAYPDHNITSAADAARTASGGAANAARAAASAAAVPTAANAGRAAAFAALAATDAIRTLHVADTDIWQSINQDVDQWEAYGLLEPADRAKWLVTRRLWPGGEPAWARENWDHLVKMMGRKGAFQSLWVDWYEARFVGRPTNDKLEIYRAMLDPKDWDKGGQHVYKLIKAHEEKVGPLILSGAMPDLEPWTTSGIDQHQKEIDLARQQAHDEAMKTSQLVESSTGTVDGETPRPEPEGVPPEDTPIYDDPAHTISDAAADNEDFLNRSITAFVLATRLNQVWDTQNPPQPKKRIWQGWFDRPESPDCGFVVHIDAPWGGGKTSFTNYLTRILNPYSTKGPLPDWYGKLPLKNTDVWPEAYHRPWHIVQFNAWQHQNVQPPWWTFYDTIRKQLMWSVRAEANSCEPTSGGITPPKPNAQSDYYNPARRMGRWLCLNIGEFKWRLFTPQFVISAITTLTVITLAYSLYASGWTIVDPKGKITAISKPVAATETKQPLKPATKVPAKPTTAPENSPVEAADKPKPVEEAAKPPSPPVASSPSFSQYLISILAVVLGGGSLLRTIFSSFFRSLVPGTPDAAKNYSYGSNDPMDRFRKHFSSFLEKFRRPVLVVVDDLDRCKPEFVVDLVRGMQTILQSRRIVFVLLGDRDWIEQAFSQVHEKMKDIDVGPEHEFGARFVEKAIQLSFVLPDISPDIRNTYIRKILDAEEQTTIADKFQPSVLRPITPDIFASVKTSQEVEQVVEETRDTIAGSDASVEEKAQAERELSAQATVFASTRTDAIEATQRRLVAIAPLLPPNPRQIKRIVNTVSLYQEVARQNENIDPGTERWQVLVRWIILMIERPKTWYTLNKYPELVNKVMNPRKGKAAGLPATGAKELADKIRADKFSSDLLTLKGIEGWKNGRITDSDIQWLALIIPPTSGSQITLQESN